MITQELVKSLFYHDDGVLYWKESPSNNVPKNSPAGSLDNRGYLRTKINRRQYLNHRLIYLLFTGELPECIDHIDGNKVNNKIENLRKATNSQNNCNAKISKRNTSGHKGVTWHKLKNKWQAQIYLQGTNYFFGLYDNIEDAVKAVRDNRQNIHQEFARHE